MFLHERLDAVAAATPDAPALLFGGGRLSFAQLCGRVAATARAVAACTRPGERVAVVADNHPVWVECYYGVPRAGRVLVFLNQRLAPAEHADILARSGATVLIGQAEYLDRLRPLHDAFPSVTTIAELDDWTAEVDALDAQDDGAGAGSASTAPVDGLAWLIFTSGTTARPKGAMLTHRSLGAGIDVSVAAGRVEPDDVYVFPFPLCHVAGYNVLTNHACGRPVVLLPRFEAAVFCDAVARHGATSASVAATMLRSIVDHVNAHPSARDQFATLRSIAYGAAPMPPALLRAAATVLPGVGFTQGYGMTELSGNAVFLGPDEHRRGLAGEERLLRAAGRPGPGVEVRVVDDADQECPAGAPGEIVVRGEQVMAGYWDDSDATAAALAGGWLHTGDIGLLDGDGLLHVVDRKKDMIVTGGENVASREVEDVLTAQPGVAEAAVVGVPDPRWGERVCAVVVLASGADVDAATLQDAVRARLAGFKVPKEVVFLEALPKNAAGKIVKQDLRRALAEGDVRP